MMNSPKVTVITPSFDSAETIEACILSVAGQSYPHKEHLIIDNESSDRTLEIVRKHAAKHPDIRIVSEKDKGIYDAMNKGIGLSEGEWVYFLGSDDTLFNDRVLEDIFTGGVADDTDVIYGNVQWGADGGTYDGEFSCAKLMSKNICHQAIFFRKELFERYGRFDLRYKALADWAHNIGWFGNDAVRRAYLDITIATYNPNGFSANYHDSAFFEDLGEMVRQNFSELHYELFETRLEAQANSQKADALSGMLAERDRQLAESARIAVDTDRHVANLTAILADRDRRLEEVESSVSWKLTKPFRNLSSSVKKRMKKLRKRMNGEAQPTDRNDYRAWVAAFDTLSPKEAHKIAAELKALPRQPKVSIVMPVFDPSPAFLDEAIRSVRAQLYPNWQLCIADDCSTDKRVREIIRKQAKADDRIVYTFRRENGHISEASNSALEMATGEITVFLDHDDMLAPDAIYHVACEFVNHPEAMFVYSDEDKLGENNTRESPYFKSDFNYSLLLSHNMFCHLVACNTTLLRETGGFRKGFEGSQDYDLALRIVEKLDARQIRHIPKVLYHWRIHKESTAASGDQKPYAQVAALNALNEHLGRKGIAATAEPSPEVPGMNRVRYHLPDDPPSVDIIILTRDKPELLRTCIDSVLTKTGYPDYRITIVDNGSQEEATLDYLAGLRKHPAITVIRDESPFNYSHLNNMAAWRSEAEYLCLMNNDIEIISPDWLDEMMGHALQENVGAVGARLWYPDERLQHGGVVLGIGGVAGHAFKYIGKGEYGYFGRACLQQEFSAVTGACLLVRKEHFDHVGGLDAENLPVAFNDVDFCLKLRERGLRNIWTPYAEMYHHESASRRYEDTPEKAARFRKEVAHMERRWSSSLKNDFAYSPNLTLEHEDFSYAWPPRRRGH